MSTASITHGDDLDGLICGALLKRLFGARVIPANYDDLEMALASITPDVDRLFITDLNLRIALIPLIEKIARHSSITIIDHHPIEVELVSMLLELRVELIHDTRDCASVLVYNHYKSSLEREAARLAAYAAVSDMFDDGPIASRLLDGMDRKFTQHEALLLGDALGADQSLAFKERVLDELSRYSYPHRIKGTIEASISHLEKIVQIKEVVSSKALLIGRLAYMECGNDLSTGEIANVIMDTLLVPVGMCWKKENGLVNISLRGDRRLKEHLGDLARDLSKRYGGFGGGHSRASGAKVPIEKLEEFIADLESALNG